jgi:hypothetical protein
LAQGKTMKKKVMKKIKFKVIKDMVTHMEEILAMDIDSDKSLKIEILF